MGLGPFGLAEKWKSAVRGEKEEEEGGGRSSFEFKAMIGDKTKTNRFCLSGGGGSSVIL